jgi:acyl carrier protein
MEATQIEEQIRDMICQMSGLPRDFDRDGHLYLDLGVASMHALQLLTEIEDRYGVQVPDDEFVEASSLAKIGGLVVRLVGS